MFTKLFFVAVVAIACVQGKPGIIAPLAYSAPLVAAPGVVTAQSSQVIARNYNGIAPLAYTAAAYTSPIAAAYTSPLAAAYSAPLTAAYSPYAYAASPYAYAASPYAAAAYSYNPYVL